MNNRFLAMITSLFMFSSVSIQAWKLEFGNRLLFSEVTITENAEGKTDWQYYYGMGLLATATLKEFSLSLNIDGYTQKRPDDTSNFETFLSGAPAINFGYNFAIVQNWKLLTTIGGGFTYQSEYGEYGTIFERSKPDFYFWTISTIFKNKIDESGYLNLGFIYKNQEIYLQQIHELLFNIGFSWEIDISPN